MLLTVNWQNSIISVSIDVFFSVSISNLGCYTVFPCLYIHSVCDSSSVFTFNSTFWHSWDGIVDYFSFWLCLMVCQNQMGVHVLTRKWGRVPFQCMTVEAPDMWFINGDVNFSHVAKIVSFRFFTMKLAFPSIINPQYLNNPHLDRIYTLSSRNKQLSLSHTSGKGN